VELAAVGGVGPDASALMTIVVGGVESIMAQASPRAAPRSSATPTPARKGEGMTEAFDSAGASPTLKPFGRTS
jgi:hypothetical protein